MALAYRIDEVSNGLAKTGVDYALRGKVYVEYSFVNQDGSGTVTEVYASGLSRIYDATVTLARIDQDLSTEALAAKTITKRITEANRTLANGGIVGKVVAV